ncbi:MAG: hypothetical protein SV253_04950 [Halobacteria archaeon]|nr:hypothetical protein [Halobacteria archaeon]
MRVPVPKNSLVVMALIGAVLTGGIAYGLATTDSANTGANAGQTVSQDSEISNGTVTKLSSNAPTPNQNFTPNVKQQTGYSEEYEEEYDEKYEEEEYEEEEYEGERGGENREDEEGD